MAPSLRRRRVWAKPRILHFTGRNLIQWEFRDALFSGTAAKLGKLLVSGRAAMAYPVWLELFQGIRGKAEETGLAARALPGREIPAPHHEGCEKCGLDPRAWAESMFHGGTLF
jgi:hypothetical protein